MAVRKRFWFFLLAFIPLIPLEAAPIPVQKIPYGIAPEQFGELRIPSGKGPFPVIIVIHGGCWLAAYDIGYIIPLSEWLTEQGFATWTIEYRRIGNPGGGWPGTFLDVAQAADALREISKKEPLDLTHTFALGHSAGGQLALWLASRNQLEKSSELFLKDPLPIQGIIGLAAITDLLTYRNSPANGCNGSVDRLLQGTLQDVPMRFKDTSPAQRLPLGVPQFFIQGDQDQIVETDSVRSYVDTALKAGDKASLILLPAAGHFEATVPTPEGKTALKKSLQNLMSSIK